MTNRKMACGARGRTECQRIFFHYWRKGKPYCSTMVLFCELINYCISEHSSVEPCPDTHCHNLHTTCVDSCNRSCLLQTLDTHKRPAISGCFHTIDVYAYKDTIANMHIEVVCYVKVCVHHFRFVYCMKGMHVCNVMQCNVMQCNAMQCNVM